jgi:hypothetical protein
MTTSGEQEPGGSVPPYEGRRQSAEPDQQGETYRDGARVGGATGPVSDAQAKAPDPAATPGGATKSPGDNQPAEDMPETSAGEGSTEAPAQVSGTPKGERGGA